MLEISTALVQSAQISTLKICYSCREDLQLHKAMIKI